MTRYEKGFLTKCAEHGVPFETASRLLKQSAGAMWLGPKTWIPEPEGLEAEQRGEARKALDPASRPLPQPKAVKTPRMTATPGSKPAGTPPPVKQPSIPEPKYPNAGVPKAPPVHLPSTSSLPSPSLPAWRPPVGTSTNPFFAR